MTRPRKPDPLAEAVRKRERRAAQAREEGQHSPWENLAVIGSLAWQVLVPTLLGVFIGRWLDRVTGHPVLFSALGIVVGVALGFFMACCQPWRRK
ncbi:AtpZ/AtpI family protein [Acidimangrovimonas sediminis]|uniref:AtpZ/AtpI family protein n=1 Tax=Acidimangrovimonas sediminis TaxID=2056283 RepID=UPI000C7F81D7|nr:AtpZ/AtpI family protein [Acidimangrovimonas sediminis]